MTACVGSYTGHLEMTVCVDRCSTVLSWVGRGETAKERNKEKREENGKRTMGGHGDERRREREVRKQETV